MWFSLWGHWRPFFGSITINSIPAIWMKVSETLRCRSIMGYLDKALSCANVPDKQLVNKQQDPAWMVWGSREEKLGSKKLWPNGRMRFHIQNVLNATKSCRKSDILKAFVNVDFFFSSEHCDLFVQMHLRHWVQSKDATVTLMSTD